MEALYCICPIGAFFAGANGSTALDMHIGGLTCCWRGLLSPWHGFHSDTNWYHDMNWHTDTNWYPDTILSKWHVFANDNDDLFPFFPFFFLFSFLSNLENWKGERHRCKFDGNVKIGTAGIVLHNITISWSYYLPSHHPRILFQRVANENRTIAPRMISTRGHFTRDLSVPIKLQLHSMRVWQETTTCR